MPGQSPHEPLLHCEILGYTASKPKGPVLENTTSEAVAAPTDSGVLSRPNFRELVRQHPHGFGRDGLTRKDGRTASDVFSTSRPPAALENANGGFPCHSRRSQDHDCTHGAQIRAQPRQPGHHPHHQPTAVLAAFNACNLASCYIERGNFAAARRKLAQALASVNQLAEG